MENNKTDKTELGAVRIHNEVVAAIVASAALDIEGVVGMASGLAGGIAQLFGKKSFEKGVKVNIEENKATVNISIIVKYGYNIPKIAKQVQIKAKEAVEEMTGLSVLEINVNIQAIKSNEV
jgi:uncharacterized alkaline shock family protein YloU